MTYAAMLDRYVLGDGLQEAEEARMGRRRHGLEEPATFLASVAVSRPLAEAAGYRHLATWLRSPTAPAPDEVFDLGLDWLLEGIADALRGRGPVMVRGRTASRRHPAARHWLRGAVAGKGAASASTSWRVWTRPAAVLPDSDP